MLTQGGGPVTARTQPSQQNKDQGCGDYFLHVLFCIYSSIDFRLFCAWLADRTSVVLHPVLGSNGWAACWQRLVSRSHLPSLIAFRLVHSTGWSARPAGDLIYLGARASPGPEMPTKLLDDPDVRDLASLWRDVMVQAGKGLFLNCCLAHNAPKLCTEAAVHIRCQVGWR